MLDTILPARLTLRSAVTIGYAQMRRVIFTKTVLSGCSFLMAAAFACSSNKSQPPQTTDVGKPPAEQRKEPGYASDPTCCGLISVGNQGVDRAWRLFVSDGRYRLARKEDFKSPARAFGSDHDPLNSIFAYCWGRLGYDVRDDHWYHLAAIVVDTSRSEHARFGLVIFSAPKDGDGSYQPYWLY